MKDRNCKYQGTMDEEMCRDCDGEEPCRVPCGLQFFCPMQPPTATQQMHQVRVVNGKPQFYEPPEVAQARAKLLSAVFQHRPTEPYRGPVSLMVKWCFPVAKGKHRDGEYRITKPDTDNLQKMLKDVMTQCGYWADDAQVCREIVEKFWAEIPGIFIQVEALHDIGS